MKMKVKYIRFFDEGEFAAYIKFVKKGIFGRWRLVYNPFGTPQIFRIVDNKIIAV